MPQNQFLPFATGGGANVLSNSAYQALAARLVGFVAGQASSAQANTAIRQSSSMSAMLGQWIADHQTADVLDNGDLANLEQEFTNALAAYVTGLIQGAGAASVLYVIQSQFLITSAVSKTVYGSGADFPNLGAAMAWISGYQIAHGGSVTFNCAAGQWNHVAPINLDHPNQNLITINGANLLTTAPTGSSFSCTGNTSGARATDATTNIAMLRGIYATELRFTGGSGGFVCTGPLPVMTNLLITGDGAGSEASGANGIASYAGINPLNVSIHGFGGDGLLLRGSLLNLNASRVLTVSACALGSASGALNLQSGASIFYAGAIIVSGCNASGISMSASTVTQNGGSIISKGNSGNGVSLNDGGCSFAGGPNCGYQNNGGNGVVAFLGSVDVHNAQITGNSSYGLAVSTGTANAQAASFSPTNGGGTMTAVSGGYINALSAAALGTESPTVNTLGNGNSYIRN